MQSQLLSTDGFSPRASGGHKVAVVLSAAVGLLAGAFLAVSVPAPTTAEPINLAALAIPTSSIALQKPALFQRSPSNQLRGTIRSSALTPVELKELRAEEDVLQKVAQKIVTAAGVAGIVAHPIGAHAATAASKLEAGLTNGEPLLYLLIMIIPMLAADRLARSLREGTA